MVDRRLLAMPLAGPDPDPSRSGAPRRVLVVAVLTLWSLSAGSTAAAIAGRIVSGGQRPIEHARIELAGAERVVFSGPDGDFEIPGGVEFPATLIIGHPRFESSMLELAQEISDLEIVLVAKQSVYETIAVSANRGRQNFAPVTIASSVVEPRNVAAPISSVGELLVETPAVAETGQGGAFQTFSIRGVARQRIVTLVSGMRIVGERRAGVSASFADPLLLGAVDVVRGPSSTYYGSGALGGVVQVFPRDFERFTLAMGFESQGGESHLLLGGGNARSSWGMAIRDAGNASTPDGQRLFTQFRQSSGSLRRSWERRGLGLSLSVLAARATDIGKANTDFPDRATSYPQESHLIARFGLERPAVWSFEAALHPNRLETRVVENRAFESRLRNEAFDVGLSWQKRIHGPRLGALRLGADYFGRRGVAARERIDVLDDGAGRLELEQSTLAGGEEDELGVFGAWEWNRGPAVVIAGGRLAWQRQRNAGTEAADDQAVTAFAGVVVPVGGGFELAANIGSGLRFPSLSERFFSGTTGRGIVVGNRNLDPERSLNLDLGMRFYGERLFVSGYLFRNQIDDYIERLEIEADRLTFANISSGRIEGMEIESVLQLPAGWSLSLGGHAIDGRDDTHEPLVDIPAGRLYLGIAGEHGPWSLRLRWESRASKDDPGSGEKAIPAADLLSGSLGFRLRDGIEVRAALRNALDELYFSSADRKAMPAPGRSFSVSLRWVQSGA